MSIRTERVGRMIQREVADLLQGEFHEPSQQMVTITEVRMTPDLGVAYVNLSVLGDTQEQRKVSIQRVQELSPQIRTALAARIRHQVRRIPELKFFLDETPQQAARMEEIFAQIRADRKDESSDEESLDD
ncbi:30S ribosome-binding factor RbfA [soil metagenome]